MATSVSRVYLTGCNYELAYDLLGQNSANNTSTVRLYGILHVTNNQISWTRGTASVHTESGSIGTYYARGDHVVIQRDFTWSHDGNGNFSAYVGASLSTTFVSGDTGGVINLPHIDRFATMTDAISNPNDESDFWFKYSNPANASMSCWLEPNPNGTHYAERTLSGKSGTYTWELTETERNQLRAKLANASGGTGKIRIGLFSTLGGTTQASYFDRAFTIINANPTFTYTNTEINSKVSALLGSTASTVVQNASKVRFVVTPTALKGATISKVEVIHGGKTYTDTSSPYQIDVPVTANSFTIKVTDSRSNSTSQTITKTMIAYKNVDITSLTIKRQNQTSSNIRINLEAVYYQKNFGSTANVPIVKWKLDNGSYTTIPSSSYTIANNKLTISNYTLSNVLPYTSSGTFTIQITDKISSDTDSRNVTKGVATFDAGEHDLQVNGDLFIADTSRANAWNVGDTVLGLKGSILWTNSDTTSNFDAQDIALSSSNYDVLEFIFIQSTTTENIEPATKVIKGYNGNAIYISTTLNSVGSRTITRNSDTSYNIGNYFAISGDTGGNNRLIPLYVIGYNTGLFN